MLAYQIPIVNAVLGVHPLIACLNKPIIALILFNWPVYSTYYVIHVSGFR